MSAHTPIIPPGSPLQRSRPDRNSKLIIAVFTIVAAHVLLLSGLLIQGCKRDEKGATATQDTASNSLPAISPAPTAPADSASIQPAPDLPAATTTAPTNSPTVVTESAPATASSPTPAASAPEPNAKAEPAAGPLETKTVSYTVKAGDTLTKIAKAHGTTVRAIREANNLKTDRILVGKKLKVPQGVAPVPSAGQPPAPAPSSVPPQ